MKQETTIFAYLLNFGSRAAGPQHTSHWRQIPHAICAAALLSILGTMPVHSEDLPWAPGLFRAVSPEGVRIFARENDRPSGAAAVVLRVEAGSSEDANHRPGIAHFVEHLFFQNRGRNGVAMEERLRGLGLVPGRTMNAVTTPGFTEYEFHLATADPVRLRELLVVLKESMTDWSIEADDLERERTIIQREIATRSGPMLDLARATNSVIFAGTPFENVDLAGAAESVGSITLEAIDSFVRELYIPERMALHVVGDLQFDEIVGVLQSVFDASEPGPVVADRSSDDLELPQEVAGTSPRARIVHSKIKSAAEVLLVWPAAPDPMLTVADLRRELIGHWASAVLDFRLEAERDASHGAENGVLFANAGLDRQQPGYRFVAGMGRGNDWEALLRQLVAVLPGPNRALTVVEWEEVGNRMRESINASPPSMDTSEVIAELAGMIDQNTVVVERETLSRQLLALMDEITLHEVAGALGGFLDWESMRLVVTLPDMDEPQSGAGELLALARRFWEEERRTDPSVSRPYTPSLLPPSSGTPEIEVNPERSIIAGRPLDEFGYRGGRGSITLLADDSLADDRFHLQMVWTGGELGETDATRGLLSLTANLLGAGGLPASQTGGLRRWLASQNFEWKVEARAEGLLMLLSGPSENLEEGLAFFAEVLATDELGCEETTNQWRMEQQVRLRADTTDRGRVASAMLRQMLFPNDPSAIALSETILRNVGEDLASVEWRRIRQSESFRLAMIIPARSDIDALPMIEAALEHGFAEIPRLKDDAPSDGGTSLDEALVEAPTLAQVVDGWRLHHSHGSGGDTEVKIAWEIPSGDVSGREGWSIFAQLLGEGLRQVLREENGWTYSQSASFVASRRAGERWFIVLGFSCAAEDVEDAVCAARALVENSDEIELTDWLDARTDWLNQLSSRWERPDPWLQFLTAEPSTRAWGEHLGHLLEASGEAAPQASWLTAKREISTPAAVVVVSPEN